MRVNYNSLEEKQNASTALSESKVIKLRKVQFDTSLCLNFS